MGMDNLELLKKYCRTISVSGFETDITDLFIKNLCYYSDHNEKDSIGNAYAMLNNKGMSTIMVEAHCDEIGFQVIHISDSGLLYLRRNGGVDEQCLPGSIVTIRTNSGDMIEGVIGKKPIHLMTSEDRRRTSDINQLWVDTGLPANEVKKLISIGDTVAQSPNFKKLGSRIIGKALDNRVGLYIITRAFMTLSRKRPCNNIMAVATVQEEVGSRGAVIAAYRCHPEVAITVDLDFATDLPDMSASKYGSINLGGGVIIPINADSSSEVVSRMIKVAQRLQIPFQLSARPHATGGTNTSRIQLTSDGIKTISLGIPCRYMHTPVEMCDINDIEAAIHLLTEYCYEFDTKVG